ncbi:MAG: gliding motility protein GldC [Bacteroidota bacterium]|nr:gliding motility protein GldC [Bacteroidota bacterium]
MKKSEIKIEIELDGNNIPEKIYWDATEKQPKGREETNAFCFSLWEPLNNSTLKIDLWSKSMPVDDMKRFYIETIGGLAESLKNATGDQYMVEEINALCERLGKHLEAESKKG